MQVSEQGIALIRRFEGFSAVPYQCPAGLWTIGYGHALAAKEKPKLRLTRAEAEELLKKDTEQAAAALRRNVALKLAQNQFDALASFIFNIGAGAFVRSTLLDVVNRGWHEEVPAQLRRWIYAGGKIQPGLVARRKAESELYLQG